MSPETLLKLEDSIFRLVERFRALQSENRNLEVQLKELKQELEELESKKEGQEERLRRLDQERQRIRQLVESAIRKIGSLEDPASLLSPRR